MILFSDIKEEKKVLVITESQEFDLILEAASLQDIYDKYYSNIPQEDFNQIIQSDPTWREEAPDKMGKFGKWLLSLYQKGNLRLEDLYKARDYLSIFLKFNGKIANKDIMTYKTLPDLYDTIKPFLDDPQQAATKSEEIRNIKQGAEKVYEDGKWLVVVPHTKEASCFYGKGTQWCTAATSSQNMFDYYNERGNLYINILKGTNKKYQFHFETNSFMDVNDREIRFPIAKAIGLSTELVNYYIDKYGKNALPLTCDYSIEDFTPIVKLDDFYIDDDMSVLYMYDEDDKRMVTVLNARPLGLWFSEVAFQNRFIPLSEDMYINNIYDTQRMKLCFDENVEKASRKGDYVVTEFKNGKGKGIFSLQTCQFTTKNLPENTYIYGFTHNDELKMYDSGLALIYTTNENEPRNVALFSMSQGKLLSDFIYHDKSVQSIIYKGKIVYVLVLHKTTDRYFNTDVLLFDGTTMDYPTFCQTSDQVLSKYIS